MQMHTLKPGGRARKQRKRVGRGHGSGNGKTCGRGHKGQLARSGYSRHYGFEGGQMPLHRRLPKRGFRRSKRWPVAAINVDTLSARFSDGDEITPQILVERGLVEPERGGVKVLGRGELDKKLTVRVQAVSPSAREKIEGAGGTVEIVPREKRRVAASAEAASEAPAVAPSAAPAAEAEAAPAEAVEPVEVAESTESAEPAEAAEAPAEDVTEESTEASETSETTEEE